MINRSWMGLFVSFLVILNGLFIGLEQLYKETIRNQWASHQLLANQAFLELDRLNSWTVATEATLSISVIIIAVWLIIKKEFYLKKLYNYKCVDSTRFPDNRISVCNLFPNRDI